MRSIIRGLASVVYATLLSNQLLLNIVNWFLRIRLSRVAVGVPPSFNGTMRRVTHSQKELLALSKVGNNKPQLQKNWGS
ncbi:MAG: hypothetical protein ABII96_02240 [Candidatus Zixiibacteriota bacterium]